MGFLLLMRWLANCTTNVYLAACDIMPPNNRIPTDYIPSYKSVRIPDGHLPLEMLKYIQCSVLIERI